MISSKTKATWLALVAFGMAGCFATAEVAAYGRQGYCGGAINRTTGAPAEDIPCGP